jgi:hypothetical protein
VPPRCNPLRRALLATAASRVVVLAFGLGRQPQAGSGRCHRGRQGLCRCCRGAAASATAAAVPVSWAGNGTLRKTPPVASWARQRRSVAECCVVAAAARCQHLALVAAAAAPPAPSSPPLERSPSLSLALTTGGRTGAVHELRCGATRVARCGWRVEWMQKQTSAQKRHAPAGIFTYLEEQRLRVMRVPFLWQHAFDFDDNKLGRARMPVALSLSHSLTLSLSHNTHTLTHSLSLSLSPPPPSLPPSLPLALSLARARLVRECCSCALAPCATLGVTERQFVLRDKIISSRGGGWLRGRRGVALPAAWLRLGVGDDRSCADFQSSSCHGHGHRCQCQP